MFVLVLILLLCYSFSKMLTLGTVYSIIKYDIPFLTPKEMLKQYFTGGITTIGYRDDYKAIEVNSLTIGYSQTTSCDQFYSDLEEAGVSKDSAAYIQFSNFALNTIPVECKEDDRYGWNGLRFKIPGEALRIYESANHPQVVGGNYKFTEDLDRLSEDSKAKLHKYGLGMNLIVRTE